MDIATTVRNVHEIIKEDISGTFDSSLVFRKAKERGNTELTESLTLQSLEFLRKMRIIEGTSDSGKEFKITDVGLNVPLELVEKKSKALYGKKYVPGQQSYTLISCGYFF